MLYVEFKPIFSIIKEPLDFKIIINLDHFYNSNSYVIIFDNFKYSFVNILEINQKQFKIKFLIIKPNIIY